MLQEQESAVAMKSQPYRLLERSVFCDRMVFVESLKDSKLMSEMELSIYNAWCPHLL
jgi:deoxyadenosine/deoxycytidine kinase